MWEEIDINAVAGDHLATIALDAPEPLTLHVYGLSSWQGAPILRNDEHSELRWFTIDAIAHMTDLVSPLYRPVIASLRS